MENGLEIVVKPELLFNLWGIPVTNTVITALLAGLFLMAVAVMTGRAVKAVPGAIQNLLESIVSGILDAMYEILGSRSLADKAFPLIVTLFLFILTANWMEFLPGIGSIKFFGEHSAPLLRSVNTDLNVTIALAIISVVFIEWLGFSEAGFKAYGGKFINLKGPLHFFVGLIELVSEYARLVSFSFRLFGNIFAGEVLIAVMSYFLPVLLPVPFMLFEVGVGFLQAAIFAGLTLIFIKVAVVHHQ